MLERHQNLAFWIASAAIFLCMLVNLALYGSSLLPRATTPAPQALLDDPAQSAPLVGSRAPLSSDVGPGVGGTAFPIVPLTASAAVLGGGAGVFLVLSRRRARAKRRRDERRRQDLTAIAAGFVAYHRDHGRYPLALNTAPEYYAAVNLTRDWRWYGFPAEEEMRVYLPTWPPCDPVVPPDQKEQTNAYLYFPHDNGQRFDLYAHLEAPDKNAPDYNRDDGLARALGIYTFKASSRPPAAEPIPAAAPDPKPPEAMSA